MKNDGRVDVFIVGAAKSGTTTIYRGLEQHPKLYLPKDKEPHFFGNMYPRHKKNKYPSFKSYLSIFGGSSDDQLLVEASTGYLYSETAPKEIFRHNPNAKIIILLRNPVDRAHSLFWHHKRDFSERGSFEQALEYEDRRIAEKDGFGFHYLASGLYSSQVARYMKTFPSRQIKIFLMEDIKENPDKVYSDIFKFLDIPDMKISGSGAIHNKSGSHRNSFIGYLFARPNLIRKIARKILPHKIRKFRVWVVQKNLIKPEEMKEETKLRLMDFFSKDIRELQQYIDRDLSNWLKP